MPSSNDLIAIAALAIMKPAATGDDDRAWAQNRRDEFEVVTEGEPRANR
jgi:hypothetical protein